MDEHELAHLTPEQQIMLQVFGAHMNAEMVTQNVDDALATMTATPHVNHVPVLTGGAGSEAVRVFYA
ncbi:MAG: hypothetical protein M3Q45_08855, partial [Chloroflexota bacterium]|nr:hypothetical protein [Chloroflexota bacterium]